MASVRRAAAVVAVGLLVGCLSGRRDPGSADASADALLRGCSLIDEGACLVRGPLGQTQAWCRAYIAPDGSRMIAIHARWTGERLAIVLVETVDGITRQFVVWRRPIERRDPEIRGVRL